MASKIYDDEIIAASEEKTQQALEKLNDNHDSAMKQTDGVFRDQIEATKSWADTQIKTQQEQTDFAIEKIEQQKDQTQKDYTKEQSGAYVDWQKQSGEYGVNAEQMAEMGMEGTGYAESSQVSMYNTYQNRVATAREAYTRAVLNYDNAIKDAILQNNAVLAEIAAIALQQQLEIALEAFQYKNAPLEASANAQPVVINYETVLDDIDNTPVRETGVVTNRTGNGWMEIDGIRYSTSEFENKYAHGSVEKQVNKDGSVTYKKGGADTKDTSAYWTR